MANSYKISVPSRRRKFVRLLTRIHSEIDRAIVREYQATGTTKSDIAGRLAVHKSTITKRLNGNANLTLRSIADLAWALNQDIEFRLTAQDTSRNLHSDDRTVATSLGTSVGRGSSFFATGAATESKKILDYQVTN